MDAMEMLTYQASHTYINGAIEFNLIWMIMQGSGVLMDVIRISW
jgi:hypothetical protein